jgi:4-diphosphocytidyl-2-C-methyl-D-erythritol kinase
MGKSIEVSAPAKVNLFLEVLRRRPDGYHDLESVFQAVSLCDQITISLTRGHEVRLTCSRPELQTPENLCVKAVKAFNEGSGLALGADISLKKTIPVQAGLGGGSSDAAATLKAINTLAGEVLDSAALAGIAARLGSDVPFFLRGGTAIVTGRGEKVEPLDVAAPFYFVIYYPAFGLSTAEVYKNLTFKLTDKRRTGKVLCSLLTQGNLEAAEEHFYNRLEETAYGLDERLPAAGAEMRRRVRNKKVVLCGSGTSLFSAFVDHDKAYEAYGALRGIGAGEVFLAESVRSGGNTGSAKGAICGDF